MIAILFEEGGEGDDYRDVRAVGKNALERMPAPPRCRKA